MARVSDVELEKLKRDVSLVRLCEAKGVALTRQGPDNLVGLCPFHEETTGSFVVSPKKNVFHCLGCRAGGSVIDFVMKAEGVSFRHAVELLRNDVALTPTKPGAVKHSSVRRLPSPVNAEADDAAMLGDVVSYYQQQLAASDEAMAYLQKRGVDETAARHFRLGYANRTLGLRLPEANRVEGAKVRGRLQQLGVYRESGHEHLAGCVVVPLVDEAGAVRGLYGRKTSDGGLRPGAPKHLYLPGPHRCAFNSAGLAEGGGSAIVCEAILDALAFWCAGFKHVTAAYGTAGFTPHHLEALRRHQVKDVFIAYDRDDAGDAAAEALAVELGRHGFDCYRVEFPRGMDANEYALKVQPASKSLGVALRHARFMGSGSPKTKQAQPPLLAAAGDDSASRASSDSVLSARGEKRAAVTTSAKTATPEAPSASVLEPGAAAAAHLVPSTAARVDPPSPAPSAPPSSSSSTTKPGAPSTTDDEGIFTFGQRRYRLRGLSKPHTPDTLRLNVLLGVGEAFHVDTFDLYSAKARAAFVQQASLECGQDADTVKRDVGQLLLQVEALLDKRREEAKGPKTPTLTEDERAAALELLQTPGLLTRILEDFGRCGVVGEETNKLVGYLAAVSRKLDEPLAVLIQSSSAAGKSSLMEAVLAFVPEEEKTKFSAMTGQSLFYMGDVSLSHKVLAVVEEEGASRAAYALKLLQSEGELTIASTGKDPHTGRLVTHEYRVEGPTQLFLTTTATELDEELLNRCLVLTVDEDRAQTKAIHQQQREKQTLEGLLARRAKDAVLALHQNAQRLLRPLAVINPYAHQLTFLDDRTRARRDFPKYLTLIRAIALLHQYQREVKTATHAGGVVEYVEVQASDIETANALASAVLGRTLDELPPQTRRLLSQLEGYVAARAAEEGCPRAEVHFTRRQLREALKAGNTQLKLHLGRLTDFEYLRVHAGARGHDFVYSLREGVAAAAAHAGLTEATTLHGRMGGLESRKSGAEVRKSGVAGLESGAEADLREAGKPSPLQALAAFVPQVGRVATAHSGRNSAVVTNSVVVPMGEVP